MHVACCTPGWAQGNAAQQRRPVIPDWVLPLDPKYLALTVAGMPKSADVAGQAKLPLGVIVQPLAETGTEIPVVNFGSLGVVRCESCRGYINPYVTFTDGGARWICNLCNKPNAVPSPYFAQTDQSGKRVDLAQRPELYSSAVEIVASGEYMMRQPMPPTYVFLLDVSRSAVESGMLRVACDTILANLDSLPGGERTMVGFLTVDSSIHFYSLRATAKQPQMLVVTELDDIFLPAPQDLLVNLRDARAQVEQLLRSLRVIHGKTQNVELAFGPAIDAAVQLSGTIGGKIIAFLSGLPSLGHGRLANRDDARAAGSKMEVPLLNPASDLYKARAVRMTKYQLSVDVFFAANTYVDVATISELSKHTGGQIYHYTGFHADYDGIKFAEDLRRCLTRQTGWEAVIRVRASSGMCNVSAHLRCILLFYGWYIHSLLPLHSALR